MCASLTDHEAHQFVWQDAGCDESHPQADVKFPSALRLHPHEEADTQGGEKQHLCQYGLKVSVACMHT